MNESTKPAEEVEGDEQVEVITNTEEENPEYRPTRPGTVSGFVDRLRKKRNEPKVTLGGLRESSQGEETPEDKS